MNVLIEKLKVIAVQAHKSDALFIEAAIDHIKELETKLAYYEEDITDWKVSVKTQMKGRRGDI